MKVQVLIKVEISNINIDDVMKEFPTLRMYLQWFQRTSNGMFISKAEVSRENGKDTLIGDSIDLRNSLLDWGFNEAGQYSGKDDKNGYPIYEDGDANKFFSKNPEGFKFNYYKICDL